MAATAPLPTVKIDPAVLLGKPAAPPPRKPAQPRAGRIREREHPPGLIPSEGLKPENERKPLTQEELEKLARREKAIRMKKAREARQVRDRDRDLGPER